jgi:hypothetical protein
MPKKDPASRTAAQTITPLRINRNDPAIAGADPKRRHRFGILALICAATALVAGGVWWLHYLSKNPRQPQPAAPQPAAVTPPQAEKPVAAGPEAPPAPAADPVQPAQDKEDAEQKLAAFLEAVAELDRLGAAGWGQDAYNEVSRLGREADSHLMGRQYQAAADTYGQAALLARQLAAGAGDVLTRLLKEGQSALADGNGTAAHSQFSLALMIDPSNATARKGLKRSQTIEKVMALIDSGSRNEQNNALAEARNNYREALQIDPDSQEARLALDRVAGRIREQEFRQLMSDGLAAFHRNDLTRARARLQDAKSLKPDSREASDALLQVDRAMRLARIDTLQRAALAAAQSEDWQRALQSYLAVLAIDANIQFAVQGKKQALERIRIAERLQFFLDRPQALESDQQLKNALVLIDEATTIEPRGPQLNARIEELEGLLAIAQTPVSVTIESDNLTQIAVYRVGKLGRFSAYELKLRPGTYTVVGARDGYQDVRQKIVVKPGQQSLRVTVECRVKI